MSTVSTYAVTGMTCSHCVAAVTEEISQLSGVERVSVDLVDGGDSTVTVSSATALDDGAIRDAVQEAGYELSEPTV